MDASTIRPSGVSKFTLANAPRLTENGTNKRKNVNNLRLFSQSDKH